MGLINLGRVIPVNKGEWTADKKYRELDIVYVDDGLRELRKFFICRKDNTGVDPTTEEFWGVLGSTYIPFIYRFENLTPRLSDVIISTETDYISTGNEAYTYYYVGDPYCLSGSNSASLYYGSQPSSGFTSPILEKRDTIVQNKILGETVNSITLYCLKRGSIVIRLRKSDHQEIYINADVRKGRNELYFITDDGELVDFTFNNISENYISIFSDQEGVFAVLKPANGETYFGKNRNTSTLYAPVGYFKGKSPVDTRYDCKDAATCGYCIAATFQYYDPWWFEEDE